MRYSRVELIRWLTEINERLRAVPHGSSEFNGLLVSRRHVVALLNAKEVE